MAALFLNKVYLKKVQNFYAKGVRQANHQPVFGAKGDCGLTGVKYCLIENPLFLNGFVLCLFLRNYRELQFSKQMGKELAAG